VNLHAAIDGFRHKNEQLLLRQTTLEAEAKQFQHELAELQAANDALVHEKQQLTALVHEKQQLLLRHTTLEAEAKQFQRELLQSKTLSETKAQEHTTLLQKYSNLETTMRQMYSKLETIMRQMCRQGVEQLETLREDATPPACSLAPSVDTVTHRDF